MIPPDSEYKRYWNQMIVVLVMYNPGHHKTVRLWRQEQALLQAALSRWAAAAPPAGPPRVPIVIEPAAVHRPQLYRSEAVEGVEPDAARRAGAQDRLRCDCGGEDTSILRCVEVVHEVAGT